MEAEKFHVTTKLVTASDLSAGTTADVQVRAADQTVLRAYEITANRWDTKIQPAYRSLQRGELPRITVVARVLSVSGAQVRRELGNLGFPEDTDVAVLDLRAEMHLLVARLKKNERAYAIEETYKLLLRYGHDELVRDLVSELNKRRLVRSLSTN